MDGEESSRGMKEHARKLIGLPCLEQTAYHRGGRGTRFSDGHPRLPILVASVVCYIGESDTNTVILSRVNADFKNQVAREGFGLLTTPVVYNGTTYPYLAEIDSRRRVYKHVPGSADNELVPKVSCATDGGVIRRGSRIQILLGDGLLRSFENE